MTQSDRSTFAAQVATMHAAQHLLVAERLLRAALADLPQAPTNAAESDPTDSLGQALRAHLEPLLDEHLPEVLGSLLMGGRAIYPEQLDSSITPERGAGATCP